MFANQRRADSGLGSLGAVAAVALAFLLSTGVALKVYGDGPRSAVVENTHCTLVCETNAAGKIPGNNG